jgi:hypothetical protein
MQVICKDGTMIRCRDFKATDSGVLFFQETPGQGEESDEEQEEDRESADGFIPITELRFVLPDEMVQQQAMSQQMGQPQGQGTEQPPGTRRQSGHATHQQQMQQSSGPPQRPPESGGHRR